SCAGVGRSVNDGALHAGQGPLRSGGLGGNAHTDAHTGGQHQANEEIDGVYRSWHSDADGEKDDERDGGAYEVAQGEAQEVGKRDVARPAAIEAEKLESDQLDGDPDEAGEDQDIDVAGR